RVGAVGPPDGRHGRPRAHLLEPDASPADGTLRPVFLRSVSLLILAAGLLFLVLPTLLVIPLSLSSGNFLTFPPPGYSFRWYETFLTDTRWVGALERSVVLSALGATIAAMTGMLGAWFIEKHRSPVTALVRTVAVSPIVLPPIVLA